MPIDHRHQRLHTSSVRATIDLCTVCYRSLCRCDCLRLFGICAIPDRPRLVFRLGNTAILIWHALHPNHMYVFTAVNSRERGNKYGIDHRSHTTHVHEHKTNQAREKSEAHQSTSLVPQPLSQRKRGCLQMPTMRCAQNSVHFTCPATGMVWFPR